MLAAAADSAPAAIQSRVPYVLNALLPFLSHPLFAHRAEHVSQALAQCVTPSLQPLRQLIARALLAVLSRSGGRLPPDVMLIVLRCTQELAAAVHSALPAPSFALVLPVLRALLEQHSGSAAVTDAQGKALKIVSLHTSPNLPIPRAAICRTLVRVLSSAGVQLHSAASEALVAVCSGASLDDITELLEEGVLNQNVNVRGLAGGAITRTTAGRSAVPGARAAVLAAVACTHRPESENHRWPMTCGRVYGHELVQL